MHAIYILWYRNVLKYLRSPSRLVGSLGMPFFFLVIIGFGLNNAVQMPGLQGGNYINFIAPGIVAMSVLFASMFSGIQLVLDKQFGFLKETFVAPVSRLNIMIGQAIGGATIAIIQGALVFLISLLIGVPVPGFLEILQIFVFMFLIGLAFTGLGIAFAARMEDTQGFTLIINFVIFPLFFLSGALFPMEQIPQWLTILTYCDPLTYGVQGIREAMTGESSVSAWLSLTILSGFTLLVIFIGSLLFKRIKI